MLLHRTSLTQPVQHYVACSCKKLQMQRACKDWAALPFVRKKAAGLRHHQAQPVQQVPAPVLAAAALGYPAADPAAALPAAAAAELAEGLGSL